MGGYLDIFTAAPDELTVIAVLAPDRNLGRLRAER